jgi:hypothetical protein
LAGPVDQAPTDRSRRTAPIEAIPALIHGIGKGSITRRAAEILRSTDEEMAWEDSPSPILLIPLGVKYFAFVAGAAILSGILHSGWFWVVLWLAVGAAHIGMRYWELRSTLYRLTSQRLEITSGLLNQKTVTWEVHQLGAGEITVPLILRMVRRSTLTITSPHIVLSGIREAAMVRDVLRGAGQLEGQRTDKLRWR